MSVIIQVGRHDHLGIRIYARDVVFLSQECAVASAKQYRDLTGISGIRINNVEASIAIGISNRQRVDPGCNNASALFRLESAVAIAE
jgi:hypothetical protein